MGPTIEHLKIVGFNGSDHSNLFVSHILDKVCNYAVIRVRVFTKSAPLIPKKFISEMAFFWCRTVLEMSYF
jgi:hypothetical protein